MAKVEKSRLTLGPDVAGIWDILEPQLEARARAAMAGVRAPDGTPATVTMKRDKHGRPVAMMTIPHPSGLAMQAKNGALTRAAASQGMDVHRYPRR